eukprot:scaffold349431_cov17-Prasinocladus_malaysianus.AAC.1
MGGPNDGLDQAPTSPDEIQERRDSNAVISSRAPRYAKSCFQNGMEFKSIKLRTFKWFEINQMI